MIPIKNFMTQNAITVGLKTPIYEALNMLVNQNISGLPVIDEDNVLIGVLSELDVLNLFETPANENATVEDYMSDEAITFHPDENTADVCAFFKTSNKRRVPIVDQTGKLVGIVARHDIIKLILDIKNNQIKE